MNLSIAAIEELKEILIQEIGIERVSELSESEIKTLGLFLLEVCVSGLKRRNVGSDLVTKKLAIESELAGALGLEEFGRRIRKPSSGSH
jgi:hypothetical protein